MLKIEELFAFITIGENGDEKLMSMAGKINGENMLIPFIFPNIKEMYEFLPMAEGISEMINKPFKILRLKANEEIPKASA